MLWLAEFASCLTRESEVRRQVSVMASRSYRPFPAGAHALIRICEGRLSAGCQGSRPADAGQEEVFGGALAHDTGGSAVGDLAIFVGTSPAY